jgi:hypothetical protein
MALQPNEKIEIVLAMIGGTLAAASASVSAAGLAGERARAEQMDFS